MSNVMGYGQDTMAVRKRVYFEGITTVYQGMPVCYNQDTTDNISGWSKSSDAEGTTTAEGSQNEGKFLRVEAPSETNANWHAGAVCAGSWVGKVGPMWLDIYIPNGAIVPVRTNKNCTIGDELGIASGAVYYAGPTGDGDPYSCAICMEEVNRSNTNGLVLAKLFQTGVTLSGLGGFLMPTSYQNGRSYGFTVAGDNFFKGVAGAQEYLVHFEGSKSVIASGDCYGGILKIKGENEAVQPTSYIFRALNVATNNSGTLGTIENFLGVANEGGGIATTVVGLTIKVENFGTCTGTGTVLGGIDIILCNEGTVAETEFGIRVRNENASLATEVNAVLKVQETGANTGFTYLLNVDALATISAYASTTNAPALATGDIMIPIYIAGGIKYLVAMADTGV